jgi:phosphopantothenoylcysteine decarboxylase / phosphopantothenate---cysteine ligase
MSDWHARKILLGISGGIAAYKSAELVRLFKAQGAQVKVVMTPAAQAFITPLTLQALSGEPVATDLLDPAAEAAMGHIELARWADLILVAPASADLMARLAAGMANDLLTTLCLASRAPLVLAPAMNQAMWLHPATQANLATLLQRGLLIWGPEEGAQACGDWGPGRMLAPEQLLQRLLAWQQPGPLQGSRWLITAGPTREPLDPVRYITNHSSGKMGYAIARAAAAAGAEVVLVSGPTDLPCPQGVQRLEVQTAQEMLEASLAALPGCQVVVAAAAVADYRPAQVSAQKIKKSAETLALPLVKNPDVVAELVKALRLQGSNAYVLGFAAETEQLQAHAEAKLLAKGLDAIAANDVSLPGLGFNAEHNALLLLDKRGSTTLKPQSKDTLAEALVQWLQERLALRAQGAQASPSPPEA